MSDSGTLLSHAGGVKAGLSFMNAVEGPADLLRGDYDTTGISRLVLDGFSSFDNLGAGGIISGLDIGFDTFDLGLGTPSRRSSCSRVSGSTRAVSSSASKYPSASMHRFWSGMQHR